jgi:hypothetical protein
VIDAAAKDSDAAVERQCCSGGDQKWPWFLQHVQLRKWSAVVVMDAAVVAMWVIVKLCTYTPARQVDTYLHSFSLCADHFLVLNSPTCSSSS